MSVVALLLMLAAAVALFIGHQGGWFLVLFLAGLAAQSMTVLAIYDRWRKGKG